MSPTSYQPIWADGREVSPGYRDGAAVRYQAIADYLTGWRDFSVLDFGAYGTYYCQRLTEDFGARCVAVDDDPHLTPVDGVTIIPKRLGPAAIRKLEVSDVTLCLSVLHHQPQWRNYLQALTANTGRVLFIEAANPAENLPTAAAHHKSANIVAELQHRRAIALCETPGYDPRHKRTLYALAIHP